MTTETAPATETYEMTVAIFQALLNMTSSPDHWTDKTKSLAVALHKAQHHTNRWTVELTEEDVKTVHYIVQVYTLNRPSLHRRFNNWLGRYWESYRQIHKAHMQEKEGQ